MTRIALVLLLSGCTAANTAQWRVTHGDQQWLPPIGTSIWNDDDGDGIYWMQNGVRVHVASPYTLRRD